MTRRRPHTHSWIDETQWTEELQRWKLRALRDVLRELEHICAGPRSRPKSYCLGEAVHNVVAREFDPESQVGIHLLHVLSGAVAQQIMRRSTVHPQLRALLPAEISLEFMQSYLNSRWWLDAYLQLDEVSCADVTSAIVSAISVAEEEMSPLVEMVP